MEGVGSCNDGDTSRTTEGKGLPSSGTRELTHALDAVVDGDAERTVRHAQTTKSTIDFLLTVGKLKSTKRRGWELQNLKNTESVADHMYRMAVMALVAPPMPGIDRSRCVSMAVVHDIAEALVGDITPHCGVPKAEKHALEEAAIQQMCEELGAGPAAELVRELWNEYEAGKTPEAKFVKDVDKIELLLQTAEYEELHKKKMSEFFEQTEGKFNTELGGAWFAEVASRRPPLP